MKFQDNDPVYYKGRPYVIIRVDSAGTSAELYPGDNVRGVRIKSAERGYWVSTSGLIPRNPDLMPLEEKALAKIWDRFRADDWSGAMAALNDYGRTVAG